MAESTGSRGMQSAKMHGILGRLFVFKLFRGPYKRSDRHRITCENAVLANDAREKYWNNARIPAKCDNFGVRTSYFSDINDLMAGRKSFELSVQVFSQQQVSCSPSQKRTVEATEVAAVNPPRISYS